MIIIRYWRELEVIFNQSNYYIMSETRENPFYTGIDVAFKKLNITSHDINESVPSSDEILLFTSKILQAVKFILEKKKRPDVNSIYEHFSKTGACNINEDTMYSIISELMKQKVLEIKKSLYQN